MAEKVMKSMRVSASGVLSIESDDICIEVEEKGTFSLKNLLESFDGCNVKISCSYDEEQVAPSIEAEEDGDLIDL